MQICYAAKLLVPSARRQSRCRTSAWAACLAFRFANRRWSRKALLPLRPRFIFEANTMHTLHVQLILALRSCNSSCNYSNIVLLLYFHFFQIALCTLLPKKTATNTQQVGPCPSSDLWVGFLANEVWSYLRHVKWLTNSRPNDLYSCSSISFGWSLFRSQISAFYMREDANLMFLNASLLFHLRPQFL